MVGWGGFLGVFLCIPKLLFDVFFQPAAEEVPCIIVSCNTCCAGIASGGEITTQNNNSANLSSRMIFGALLPAKTRIFFPLR